MPDQAPTERRPGPPGGSQPPAEVMLDGRWVDVRALARETSARFLVETPAYVERYGEHAQAWCTHDCQHVLVWALGAHDGFVDLGAQVAWLARVLESRGFPLDWLARDLELAADVVGSRLPRHGTAIAQQLRAVAADVRATATFLD
ncbi:MAG TPA: hypothetical protein VLK58_11835 [Conexibacter sp.]|nr:hypothetical protein [Conexibacter sp.]